MIRFHEVQVARRWWITLLLMVPLAATLPGLYQQLILGRPWGNRPISNAAFILIEIGFVALLVWLQFLRLVTEVSDDAVVLRYVGLWPERRIPFDSIASVRAITYSPIAEFGGWGVRWGWSGGMAYNARGDRGVELILTSGKRVVIGSQRASELAAAVQGAAARAL